MLQLASIEDLGLSPYSSTGESHLTRLEYVSFLLSEGNTHLPYAIVGRIKWPSILKVHCKPQGTPRQKLFQSSATELKDDRETQPLILPMSTLLRTTPTTAEDKEHVNTGAKFALKLWLQHLGR